MIPKPARQPTKLASSILNYFAAFTETRFNFRTLINYRWTDNELTLDLSIFYDFQDQIVARIKSGDRSPISIKTNQHVLRLSGDKVFVALSRDLSESFGPDYLKSCVEAEVRKVAEKKRVFVSGEGGLRPADGTDLSPVEVEDEKYGNGDLRNIYPVLGGTADSIRKLKMQRLNVGFSRAKDTMVFVHSMPVEKYAKTRLGDALKHYDKILAECRKNDFFLEDPSVFESPAEKDLYALLINTGFVKANREYIRIIPQFKIGEYLQAEFAGHMPKYRSIFS